jgi:hypothetical protein
MDDDQKAFEELKALQAIISSQEEARALIKNWLIGLITVISGAFVSGKVAFSRVGYLIISIGIIVLFLWIDTVHRVSQDRAIGRSQLVEQFLREKTVYDGPLIGRTLSAANTLSEQIKALNNIRLYFPYIILTVIVIGIAVVRW